MADDFFNQSLAPPGKAGALKSRKTRAAPPPPPPARTTTNTAAAPSYYGSSSTSTQQQQQRSSTASRAAAPPPRRPAAAAASTSHSSSTAAAPSFYGNSTGGYSSASNTAATTGTSYYSTPAPAPVPAAYGGSTTTNTFSSAPAAAASTSSDGGWYSAPAPAPAPAATTNNEWYSASQQPQQQQPVYTDFSQQQQPTSLQTSSTELAGSIGGDTTAAVPFSTFTPTPATMQSSSNLYDDNDFGDEAPLLEELGINMQHIFLKTKAVVLPFSKFGVEGQQVMHEDDNDLAGPLVFALLLGGELLLTGKLQFSYIYGFCMFGVFMLTLILNLMSPLPVSIWTVASILGYALLPVNILAICKIVVVNLGKLERLGDLLALLTIAWCTVASTRLLEQKCDMRNQRYLLAYPIALLYSAFVMITIF